MVAGVAPPPGCCCPHPSWQTPWRCRKGRAGSGPVGGRRAAQRARHAAGPTAPHDVRLHRFGFLRCQRVHNSGRLLGRRLGLGRAGRRRAGRAGRRRAGRRGQAGGVQLLHFPKIVLEPAVPRSTIVGRKQEAGCQGKARGGMLKRCETWCVTACPPVSRLPAATHAQPAHPPSNHMKAAVV